MTHVEEPFMIHRITSLRPLALALAGTVLWLAGGEGDGLGSAVQPRSAQAVVGAPATPVSVAGVARRTAVRTTAAASTAASANAQQQQTAEQQKAVAEQQAATAKQQAATAEQQAALAKQQAGASTPLAKGTVVAALPSGCVSAPKDGIEHYKCGNVYYRPAFQGNNLVYVVQ